MKHILLATTLLSTAVSENILVKNYQRPMAWLRDEQFWNRKIKRMSQDDISSDLQEFLNYDDRQLHRISDKQFISEPMKLSPVAVMRRPDLATRFSQTGLLSSDRSELGNTKSTVLISIGIQEGTNADGDSQEECSTKKKNYRHNQSWQLQKPFYVEEPQWIEIDPDYMNGPSHNSESGDPYILSRGKKIFRIKDAERLDKMIQDYGVFLDYPKRSKRSSTKNRVRRAVEMNEESRNNVVDEKDNREEGMNRYDSLQDTDKDTDKIGIIEIANRNEKTSNIDKMSDDGKTRKRKRNQPTSPVYDVKRYEKDKLNDLNETSPHEHKFTKRHQTSANDIIITNSIKQGNKMQREDILNNIKNNSGVNVKITETFNNGKNHFANDANKGSKRLALLKSRGFVEDQKKRGNRETGWKDFEDSEEDIEKEETDTFEQMKNNIDKLNDLNAYDYPFILSRGKKPFESIAKSSNRKDTNESIERRWENSSTVKDYIHPKKSESEKETIDKESEPGIDKDDTEATDTQLTNRSDSRSSGTKNQSDHRKKRNIDEIELGFQEDRWLKSIKKEISSYLKPRDKHSKLVDQLLLPTDPFFINRGKKTLHDSEDNISSTMEPREEMNNIHRPGGINLPVEGLLRMLLMERSGCDNHNYDINVNRLPKNKSGPRDRRGSLDKILNLEIMEFDPFYLVRGKRINPGNFQSDRRSQRKN